MSLPKTTDSWVIHSTETSGGFNNVKLEKGRPLPALGEHDCLVQIQAVSLNYRDLVIPKVCFPPFWFYEYQNLPRQNKH